MTEQRPRLVLLRGEVDGDLLESLRRKYEIVEVDSLEEVEDRIQAFEDAPGSVRAIPESGVRLGDGAGTVDELENLTWADDRLGEQVEQIRQEFIRQCLQTMEYFNSPGERGKPDEDRISHRSSFSSGRAAYEVVISPSTIEDDGRVSSVTGIMWEVTGSRRLQMKIDTIDAAGEQLLNLEAGVIKNNTIDERLRLLEDKIIRSVHDLLNFDNFEIRLLDRETRRLELVISVGLTPLKIGEVILAEREENGISGFVAATGQSYLCPDVQNDPLYRDGLDHAASTLTVPLKLHDEVIGVFNVESYTPNVFNQNDLLFAELYGRYIAAAMNILDLLIVERYTTNERLAENVIGELERPLADLTARIIKMQTGTEASDPLHQELDGLVMAAETMRRRIETCTSGPRTILGVEKMLHQEHSEPPFEGRRILIADDEPFIRDTLARILEQKGCVVTACADGRETIEIIQNHHEDRPEYELVITDIRMPGHTGYEVFRAAKERCADTAVILMTGFGYDPHHSIVRATQEGLHSFLFKPFQAEKMLEAVRGALTG